MYKWNKFSKSVNKIAIWKIIKQLHWWLLAHVYFLFWKSFEEKVLKNHVKYQRFQDKRSRIGSEILNWTSLLCISWTTSFEYYIFFQTKRYLFVMYILFYSNIVWTGIYYASLVIVQLSVFFFFCYKFLKLFFI
jgi:hypothetical protein